VCIDFTTLSYWFIFYKKIVVTKVTFYSEISSHTKCHVFTFSGAHVSLTSKFMLYHLGIVYGKKLNVQDGVAFNGMMFVVSFIKMHTLDWKLLIGRQTFTQM
jgi:hypothetical protein